MMRKHWRITGAILIGIALAYTGITVYRATIDYEWNGYEILDILVGVALVIITSLMWYNVDRTFKHQYNVDSSNFVLTYVKNFLQVHSNVLSNLEKLDKKWEDSMGKMNLRDIELFLNEFERVIFLIEKNVITDSDLTHLMSVSTLKLLCKSSIIQGTIEYVRRRERDATLYSNTQAFLSRLCS